jgi:hypothetical protein
MASDDPRAVTVTDLDAREVVLLARIWEAISPGTIPSSSISWMP